MAQSFGISVCNIAIFDRLLSTKTWGSFHLCLVVLNSPLLFSNIMLLMALALYAGIRNVYGGWKGVYELHPAVVALIIAVPCLTTYALKDGDLRAMIILCLGAALW